MDFKVNTKTQAQYNWKFYVKLSLGLIPLMSIIIFFSAQLADLINNPVDFWSYIFQINDSSGKANRLSQFSNMDPMPIKWWDGTAWTTDIKKLPEGLIKLADNWSNGQKVEYGIFRNIFEITTLGNIFASVFFLDSAVHNSKEGIGYKNGGGMLDNYRVGLAIINVETFIVLAYNLSLAQSHATDIMKWYNYVSWMCEHLVVPILMIVYFFVFYPKNPKSTKNYGKNKARNWFSFAWTSVAMVWIYQAFFTVLGFILKGSHDGGSRYCFPIFGDMSSNGYFPYNYMDFSSSNLTSKMMGMSHGVEFVIAMIVIAIVTIVIHAIYFASAEHQIKLDVKKQYWK